MTDLRSSLRPQCIGRYLVELPEGFIAHKPELTLYYGLETNFKTLNVKIIDDRTSRESFDKVIAEEIARLQEEKLFNDAQKSLLLSTEKIAPSSQTMLRYYSDSSGIGIDHQLHLLVGHAHIVIFGSSYEGVDDSSPDKLSPAVEKRMLKLASQVHVVNDPAKAGPGFCLGSVVVDSENDFERGDFIFDMEKHPDLTFTVSMTNQDNAPESLLRRMKDFDQYDGHGLSILRSRHTTLANVPAEEKAARIVTDREELKFVLESRPEPPSFAQEGVNIKLSTGNQLSDGRYLSSTLTQNESLELWDAIIQSFQPRPGAVRATSGNPQ